MGPGITTGDQLPLDMDPIELRARALRGLPSARKVEAPSFRQQCETRAVIEFGSAVDLSGGNRAAARYGECDESGLRNKRAGGRVKPALADAFSLPPQGKRAIALALLDAADREEDRLATG